MISKKFFHLALTFGLALQICNFSPAFAMEGKQAEPSTASPSHVTIKLDKPADDASSAAKPGTYAQQHSIDTIAWGTGGEGFGESLNRNKLKIVAGTAGDFDLVYSLTPTQQKVNVLIPFNLVVVEGNVRVGLRNDTDKVVVADILLAAGTHSTSLQADHLSGGKSYSFFVRNEVEKISGKKAASFTLSNVRFLVAQDSAGCCSSVWACLSKILCCKCCKKR